MEGSGKMNISDRSQILLLRDILKAMLKIQEFTQQIDFEDYKTDQKTMDAVAMNFVVVGESANKLSAEMKQKRPDIQWNEMYGLRNRICHSYFTINPWII